MSIQQILTVVLYTLVPYWWVFLAALVALVLSFKFGTLRGSLKPMIYPISLIVGSALALAAPYLTGSRLSYVATATDWLSLIGIGAGTAIYTFILLCPLLRGHTA